MFLSLKLENGLKKYVQNVAEIKHGFVKLVLILLLFTKCDYMILSLSFIMQRKPTICFENCRQNIQVSFSKNTHQI